MSPYLLVPQEAGQVAPRRKFGEAHPVQFVPVTSHFAHGDVHAEHISVSVSTFGTPKVPSEHLQVTVPFVRVVKTIDESHTVHASLEVHSFQPTGHLRQMLFCM